MKGPVAKAKQRPAETAGGIGALIAAVGGLLGWSAETVAAVGVTAAFLPALVTYLVELKRTIKGD